MGDGKALQAGTSHNLGQNFAKAYDIEYLDRDQQRAQPWSTSWGTSTRLIGGLIMTHGDDVGPDPAAEGGALPGGDRARSRRARATTGTRPSCPRRGRSRRRCADAGVRVHLDDRDQFQPGYKYADWEMRGVPLRLEIGPKDVEKDQCVLVRRDTTGTRPSCRWPGWRRSSASSSTTLQKDLLERAPAVPGGQHHAGSRATTTFKEVMATKRGFLLAGWCGDAAVRGADQGRDQGHHPRHPHGRRPRSPLRRHRREGPRGLLRASLLVRCCQAPRCLRPSRRFHTRPDCPFSVLRCSRRAHVESRDANLSDASSLVRPSSVSLLSLVPILATAPFMTCLRLFLRQVCLRAHRHAEPPVVRVTSRGHHCRAEEVLAAVEAFVALDHLFRHPHRQFSRRAILRGKTGSCTKPSDTNRIDLRPRAASSATATRWRTP